MYTALTACEFNASEPSIPIAVIDRSVQCQGCREYSWYMKSTQS